MCGNGVAIAIIRTTIYIHHQTILLIAAGKSVLFVVEVGILNLHFVVFQNAINLVQIIEIPVMVFVWRWIFNC